MVVRKLNAQGEDSHSFRENTLSWVAILALLVLGLFANYYYHSVVWSLRLSVGILLACVLLGLAAFTAKGQMIRAFARNAYFELRRVVWPTRKEMIQITLLVAGVVFLVVVMLWAIDASLLAAIRTLTG